MKLAHAIVLASLVFWGLQPASRAEPPPATQPAAGEINLLVLQLGDEDPAIREQATRRLCRIGQPAAEALKQAVEHGEPETRSRAKTILRRIGKALPQPVVDAGNAATFSSLRVSVSGNVRTTEAAEAGRTVRIAEQPGHIEIRVTGQIDGEPASETYEAADEEELRRDYPEVADLYEQYAKNPAFERMQVRVLPDGRAVIQPRPVAVFELPVIDPLQELRAELLTEMARKATPAKDRDEVLALHEALKKTVQTNINVPEEARPKALAEYFAASDKLRAKLEELKLTDPGDALPPPARFRLGVQLADRSLTVAAVAVGSRAANLGLKKGDVIEKVGDKKLDDPGEIRKAVADAKSPLVVEIRRDDQPLKLVEKLEAAR